MVDVRRIIRGAVARVLPGYLIGFGLFVASTAYTRSIVSPGRVALALLAGGVAALGSTIALLLMRRRLRADAGVDGRRAFLVGLGTVAIVIIIRPFLPHIGAAGEFALVAASGAALSGCMFLPWFTRRPSEEPAEVV